jgi:hypothetical protein
MEENCRNMDLINSDELSHMEEVLKLFHTLNPT